MHADMDAFYASVEQLDDPSLKGKCVIVGGTSHRGVVSTASYEARRYGVGSAMPMAEARRRCPHAVFLRPRGERYAQISARIMEAFGTMSPLVEPLSLDEAFIDMTGTDRLFGDEHRMAMEIKKRVREATGGLTVSVGISTTKFVAKVASDVQKPDGITIVPGDRVLEFLYPLPVSRLWGVGKKTLAVLETLGLRTIEDVAGADPDLLKRRLGSQGEHIRLLARGQDPREVIPEHDARSIGTEYTLDRDVTGPDQIRPHIRRAAEKVARRLRKNRLEASGVRVKLKTATFRLITRQARLVPPTDTFHAIEDGAVRLLDEFDLDQPFRLVGVAAFHLTSTGAGSQTELFQDPDRERDRRLDRTLDVLQQKFGSDSVTRGAREDEE